MWQPEILANGAPVYVAIADALSRDIRAGRLRAGERLPTHRALARALGVNVVTVTRGYAEAARRGLVDAEVGRGTFVRDRGRDDGSFLLRREGSALVDLAFNIPAGDPSVLDAGALLAELAADPAAAALDTGYVAMGLHDHRVAGAEWIGRSGTPADPERVLVCGGAQHALALAMSVVAGPGDTVLVEDVTYPGMKALASVLDLRLAPVTTDEHGLRPEAVVRACAEGAPKALYVMPTLQNPTGTILPVERRRELVAVAAEHDLALVEDDTYGFLCDRAPPTLASLAPSSTYHISTTSKSLAAGLRIGYLLAPSGHGAWGPVVERLAANVTAIGWMAAPLMAEIASRWIQSGRADAMVRWKRREVAVRRRLWDRILGTLATASDGTSSHVWLPLPPPWRSEAFVAQARRRGVAVAPAEAFVVGRGGAPHAVRVCLGTPARRQQVEKALFVLMDMLEGTPEAEASLV